MVRDRLGLAATVATRRNHGIGSMATRTLSVGPALGVQLASLLSSASSAGALQDAVATRAGAVAAAMADSLVVVVVLQLNFVLSLKP